jgi:hypothetical protein
MNERGSMTIGTDLPLRWSFSAAVTPAERIWLTWRIHPESTRLVKYHVSSDVSAPELVEVGVTGAAPGACPNALNPAARLPPTVPGATENTFETMSFGILIVNRLANDARIT